MCAQVHTAAAPSPARAALKFSLVVIGASLGGMRALQRVLGELPADFPLPVVLVQHRAEETGGTLNKVLQRSCALPIREPYDKETIQPGRVFLAPSEYHLLIEGDAFALSTDGPVSYARPSLDVLFESAADSFGAGVIGVVLTGANEDGASGCRQIKRRGGFVIVQDPAASESPEMPGAVLAATPVDRVLQLPEIAPCLVSLCRKPATRNPSEKKSDGV